MSGPKVIRIVTREEIIAICRGMLARLDAAIASWRRIGERNGTVDAADVAATEKRRDALRALLAKDRVVELQAQVGNEIAFLKADTQTSWRARPPPPPKRQGPPAARRTRLVPYSSPSIVRRDPFRWSCVGGWLSQRMEARALRRP